MKYFGTALAAICLSGWTVSACGSDRKFKSAPDGGAGGASAAEDGGASAATTSTGGTAAAAGGRISQTGGAENAEGGRISQAGGARAAEGGAAGDAETAEGGRAAPAGGTTSTEGGSGAQAGQATCSDESDCREQASPCTMIACSEGACVETPLAEDTLCAGGACDAEGQCQASTCESDKQDGDETGIDCGGSCELCDDGAGCLVGGDCRSGVCTNLKCQASACTDGVLNGTETAVDCGGNCSVNCALGSGCAVDDDCAVMAGDGAHTVSCVDRVCVSTQPPGDGLRYWQDFEPKRLTQSNDSCGASDDWCLRSHTGGYAMFGLGTSGAAKVLTASLLFTPSGAVGSGGKFDGTYCLTRAGTNLSLADLGAMTAMAWVKSSRTQAPWEGAVIGALDHYLLVIDADPRTERFLAKLATSQSSNPTYSFSTATGQVVTGEWHHVAQVYDSVAGAMVQYVDGVSVQSTPLGGTITSAVGDVLLGCSEGAALGQFFIGTLDEVALYTRALTPVELSDYVRKSRPAP
jgi:hypothetical protein